MKIRFVAAALAAVFLCPLFGTVAYAEASPPPDDTPIVIEQEAEPTPVTGGIDPDAPAEPTLNPFTPAGTGTVVDNATDADGKEFFTIMTPDENVFYLVIDRQRGSENVYFLNAVTEADLLSLAKLPEKPATTPTTPEPEQTPAPATTEPTPEQTAPEQGGNMGMVILIAAVVLVGGGAAYYFKIYRPKQQQSDTGEDFDEYEPDDTEPEDDTPPWDVDDENGGDVEV